MKRSFKDNLEGVEGLPAHNYLQFIEKIGKNAVILKENEPDLAEELETKATPDGKPAYAVSNYEAEDSRSREEYLADTVKVQQ